MDARDYLRWLAWFTVPILLLVGLTNYVIDPESSHSLPDENGLLPRSTHHSGHSKLHYLYHRNPEVLYFGSSRVVIGMPPDPALVRNESVYNAALAGATFGEFARMAQHAMSTGTPKVLVMGLEFPLFHDDAGDSGLDPGLISGSRAEYRIRRIFADLREALSLSQTRHTLRSVQAYLAREGYDPDEPPGHRTSHLGQSTDHFIERITLARGMFVHAFQIKVALAFRAPPSAARVSTAMRRLDDVLRQACERRIVVRLFVSPVHALAEDAVRLNGEWRRQEAWKEDLARLASRYGTTCDLRVVDFSGYNSVTTEPLVNLSPKTSLVHYWEASHFKSSVGAMILRKLLWADAQGPEDFGRELRTDTVDAVNAAVRAEQARYVARNPDDVETARRWAAEGVPPRK